MPFSFTLKQDFYRMEFNEQRERDEVFSKAVKAGKRTYFFDVKETKSGEKYLTITESKRKFNENNGQFSYEKHKIFLYKEDHQKFINALKGTIDFIETGIEPIFEEEVDTLSNTDFGDFSFDLKD